MDPSLWSWWVWMLIGAAGGSISTALVPIYIRIGRRYQSFLVREREDLEKFSVAKKL